MRKLYRQLLATIAAVGIVSGCSTTEIADYPSGQAVHSEGRRTVGDLTVGLRPIADRAELETYFGTDLREKGIVPIYVDVENNPESRSSYVVERGRFTLANTATLPGDAAVASAGSGEAVAMVGAVLISPLLLGIGSKMISDASVIRHNFAAKELQTQTVSPGRSANGFVYFRLPGAAAENSEWLMRAEFPRIGTGDSILVEIPFHLDSR